MPKIVGKKRECLSDQDFLHIPAEGREIERRKRKMWIMACHRSDSFVCTKGSLVYNQLYSSVHFVLEV